MEKANKTVKSSQHSDQYPVPATASATAQAADKKDMDAKAMTTVARIIASALALGFGGWLALDPGAYWDAVVWLEKAAGPSLVVAICIAVAGALISMSLPFFMELGMAGAALVGHWTVRPARMVLGMALSALAGRRMGEEARDVLGVALIVVWAILGARGFQDMDTPKSRAYGPEYAAKLKAKEEEGRRYEAEYNKRVEQEQAQKLAQEAARAQQAQERQALAARQIGAPYPQAGIPRQDMRPLPAGAGVSAVQAAQPASEQKASDNVAQWFR